MSVSVKLHSKTHGEINKFLEKYYNTSLNIKKNFEWEKVYENPIELSDIIGIYIDNNDNFDLKMWICLDKNIFINVTNENANKLIRYLFERYPY